MRAPGFSTCCILLACLLTPCRAATPARLPLTFEAIESLGSDSQSIMSLLQDRHGYIWIGTVEGGLFRYDGRRATRYANDPANPATLPAGRVGVLHEDGQGRIWVGTDEGLARFEPETNSFKRFQPDGVQRNMRIIRRIIGDGANGLWLATWGGLQHFDPATGAFRIYRADPARNDALRYNDVNAIALDPAGGLWAATWPGGLSYLAPDAQGFTHLRLDSEQQPDAKLNDVRAMRFSPDGRLWMGTDAGLVVWKNGTPWGDRQHLDVATGRVNSIYFDTHHNVWISTRTEGLMRWTRDMQHVQTYTHRAEDNHSLPSNAINTAMEDRNGTLWVGSFTDGVVRANLGNYGLERIIPRDVAPESFPSSNFVRSMAAGDHGQVWLGVDGGVLLFDPAAKRILQRYTATGKPGGLNHNSVYSLYQQPDNGPLWIGTAKGLNRLDHPGGKLASILFEVPSDNFVNAIAPGRGGVLWLGTGASLMRYDPASGAMRRYVHVEDQPHSRAINEASAVLEDSQGRVWVGEFFRSAGLDMMSGDDGRFQHFRHDPLRTDSISSDKITCLYEDLYGTVWIGTSRGLNRMVPGPDGKPAFKRYTGPGEPGPVLIESIESDTAGILWISTVRGMSRLDPNTGAFTHYAADDGLTDGLYQASSARASDGKLYFGGTTGITAVYPELPLRTPTVPLAAISDIRIYDRSLSHGPRMKDVLLEGPVTAPRALTIPWTATMLTLEFTALHYAAPKRNSYAYWMEGLDKQWVQTDASQPIASFTFLPPGDYRFHLRAYTNKGMVSEELVLPITVTPPYWHTWWFRTGAALLLIATAALLYRMRVRALTRNARALKALVARRTQELEESNRKLTALSATDGLTGLANRRSFDEALVREWGRAQRAGEPLALAMLDVDCFKLYNDHYGHQAGDECLRQVARMLAAGVHRAADVAARYGGEEFAFIAPLDSAAQAAELAERIRASIQALALPHARAPLGCVTVSIGVASIIPGEQQGPETLLRAADQALYRAKGAGRNCVMQTQLGRSRIAVNIADAL
ncbi:diguanylate cyclase (GGDEF) domain-containing protein [Duganella sp. CF402]|nr:diguanylate cyclase (GGDEF)-like protein [Duganella sp. BK701]SEL15796.1 diguanylate cyclase (GGDEF) domain-containing protein [Duganella sp. CF402]